MDSKNNGTEKHACCGSHYRSMADIGNANCTREATVERDGKWYCNYHNPDTIAKRKATRKANERDRNAVRREEFLKIINDYKEGVKARELAAAAVGKAPKEGDK